MCCVAPGELQTALECCPSTTNTFRDARGREYANGKEVRLSAEERGAWWWLLAHDRVTLKEQIIGAVVCRTAGHRWEHYRGDWEPDAHAYNPATASRTCRRCSLMEYTN